MARGPSVGGLFKRPSWKSPTFSVSDCRKRAKGPFVFGYVTHPAAIYRRGEELQTHLGALKRSKRTAGSTFEQFRGAAAAAVTASPVVGQAQLSPRCIVGDWSAAARGRTRSPEHMMAGIRLKGVNLGPAAPVSQNRVMNLPLGTPR